MCKLIKNILIILVALLGVFATAYLLLKHLGFDLPGLDFKCECPKDLKPKKHSKTDTKIKRNYTEIAVPVD